MERPRELVMSQSQAESKGVTDASAGILVVIINIRETSKCVSEAGCFGPCPAPWDSKIISLCFLPLPGHRHLHSYLLRRQMVGSLGQ